MKMNETGIRVIVLTGDNAEVTRCICDKVGIMSENIILGSKLDRLSDMAVHRLIKKNNIRLNTRLIENTRRQTKEVWIYDFRTNIHFTLKQNPMTDKDLDDFVACYNPENRHDRKETWSEENPDGRFRKFTVEEILERDKTSLDLFWIKDKSLADLDNLPDPDVLVDDIIENLQSALESFQDLKAQLKG